MSSSPKSDQRGCQGWRAVVPATSANLGCAFDCGGLALKLYLEALYIPSPGSDPVSNLGSDLGFDPGPVLTLEYQGPTPERFPLDSSNLILRAMRFGAAKLGLKLSGGEILVSSAIPIGAGLGSSAASAVAGLLLVARVSGKNIEAEQLLAWAGELEGHIDNAAAAYYGGMVFALASGIARPLVAKAAFPESIRLVVVTPSAEVPTHQAREVLPRSYERAEIVHTLQRAAYLAATVFSGRFDFFPELFDDRLHQPYRKNLVPGIESCLRLRQPGLLGLAISGSGSSVLAFVSQNEVEIARVLQDCFTREGVESQARFTSADNHGASVVRETILQPARRGPILAADVHQKPLAT